MPHNRWYSQWTTGELKYYRQIPKVDLHRHLEGSLRLETLFEVAREHQITVPVTRFHTLVQMQKEDPLTVDNFLSKFQMLRQFYRSADVIARVTREAVMDAADDNVKYLELRFTPIALGRLQGYSLAEVMDWVIEHANRAAQERNITLRLIASVNRHEPVEVAEQVIELAAERQSLGITGIDLAGNEVTSPATAFAPLFRDAHAAGLHITVHAGEWGPAENIRQAIEDLYAERIGHGVRVLEDEKVIALAKERGTVFEVCPTSNYQSGVVKDLAAHPIMKMIAAGLDVTLNTDDPGISGISLSDEYRLALEDLGMGQDVLRECVLRGARAAFLPEEERAALTEKLSPLLRALLA